MSQAKNLLKMISEKMVEGKTCDKHDFINHPVKIIIRHHESQNWSELFVLTSKQLVKTILPYTVVASYLEQKLINPITEREMVELFAGHQHCAHLFDQVWIATESRYYEFRNII